MALNAELTSRGAEFLTEIRTASHYRLFALPGASGPERPALLRVAAHGAGIALELWSIPLVEVGGFLASVPPPLGIGSLQLADGRWVKGFIAEPWGLVGARDITDYGGFRAYVAAKN
jgi:allophanate hydrolase